MPNRKTSSGYSKLRVDVRAVPVPETWRGCEYEYRHGYGRGLERDGVLNPVPHRPVVVPDRDGHESTLPRRKAWYAGYEAGKKARREVAHA